jgi:hypothetical protein
MKTLIMHLYPIPCDFLSLMSKYLLRCTDHGESQSKGKDKLSHTYKTINKVLYFYMSVYML